MSSRIYVVGAPGSNKKRLVKAASPWQAIKHAVKDKVQANVATTVEVAELMQAGVELETAEVATVKKADPTEAPADEQAVE